MDSCSYFKLIGCFIFISIATVQKTQEACKSYSIIRLTVSIFLIGCFPRDCKEAFKNGKVCSGVYTVKPDDLPAFDVNIILD